MIKRNQLIIVGLILIVVSQVHAQDQNYSQFFNNNLYYNPAYTGLYKGMRASVGYRNQWTSLPVDFKSYNVALDFAERNLPGAGGFGIIVHNNNEGEGMLQNTFAGLSLSARVRTGSNLYLQFGVSGGVVQRRIDWDRLVFSDQLNGLVGITDDPSNFSPPESSNVVVPDFNVGLVLNYIGDTRNARIGGAFHHIFTPKIGFVESESQLPVRFVVHADMMFIAEKNSGNRKSRDSRVNPGILFENQQGANTFTIGLNASKSILYVGLWYRNEDINMNNINSMIILAGVYVPFNDESRIKLMYSYDYVMNNISGTGGTHELSVIFEFDDVMVFGPGKSGPRRSRNKPLECPTF